MEEPEFRALAVLVDRTPQILQPALNLEEDFVEMPVIATAQAR